MTANKKIHFEVSERKVLLRIFDVISVLLALYVVGRIFKFHYFNISSDNYYWTIVLGVYVTTIGTVFEMYHLQVASNQYQIIKSIVLTSSTTVLLYLLTPVFTPNLPSNRMQIVFFYLAILLSLMLWRLFYVKLLASSRFEKKVILVCEKDEAEELIHALQSVDPHYRVAGFVNSDGSSSTDEVVKKKKGSVRSIPVDQLERFVTTHSISEVVIASQKTDGITVGLYNQLIHLLENGYIIRVYTQVYENITQRIPVQFVARDFYRYFPFSRSNQNQLYLLIVRLLEVAVSLIGLAVGLLLIPFILLGNVIGNQGQLFYVQERIGKNGIPFKIFKFRTMVKNAEKHGAVFATTNDARITRFGKFLRKARIDEFPQFFNVLKGDMAVIGPRPERPVFVAEIAEVMPFYETRHVIKPGLTGWAQVNYSYGETIDDSLIKLQYDLYYIKHRSIFLDINILLKTLSTVLFYRGQ